MEQCELSNEEILRRKKLSANTRKMICGTLKIMSQDEISIRATYKGFDVKIIFSELHPLMVLCLEKPIEKIRITNTLRSNMVNLTSILGSHCINKYQGLYKYRATQWLDTEITQARFLEILKRCVIEASRGYQKIVS